MALGTRAANPIWWLPDLFGLPLNDQYYISFLTNTFPYIPQPIFEDVNLTIPWANPLQFSPDGTLPNNMYWDPALVWRLEIRQGPTQSDPLIREINNFIPCCSGAGPTPPTPNQPGIFFVENQITNPQFSDISFANNLTITTPGTYPIAPGWSLILTGAGTTVLTQLILSGTQNISNNPPFALKINNSGWTTAILQQTFNNNGAIWAAGAIAGSLLGRAEITPQTVTVNYVPSDAGTPFTIFTALLTTGNFTLFGGTVDVGASTDIDLSNVAFVNIQYVLPGTGIVDLSNMQITGQSNPLPIALPTPSYNQETIERGIDHEFHFYKPQLAHKPIPSFLVGWDFPLNPAQFFGTSVAAQAVGANKSYYAWDQTILFQSANSGITVSVGQNGAINLAAATTTQMAIIQYLDTAQVRKLLLDSMAVNLSANATPDLQTTISLWYTLDGSLPNIASGTNNSLVATLDANGKPATFNGNWTEIPRRTLQNAAPIVQSTSNDTYNDYNFNGWTISGGADGRNATFFAIVIGTASMVVTNALTINSISLMNGEIATRPAPQTEDEVLRECQFYYEKSYSKGVVPGATTGVNAQVQRFNTPFNGASSILFFGTFVFPYSQTKRAIPTFAIFSVSSGAQGQVTGFLQRDAAFPAPAAGTNPQNFLFTTSYNLNIGLDRAELICKDTSVSKMTINAGLQGDEALIGFQYVLDARLGVV